MEDHMKLGFWRRIAPLLTVIAVVSVLGSACSGGSSASPPPKTNSDGSITYYLKADNMKFDSNRMSFPAGVKVTVVFNNADSVQHNFSVYKERSAPNAIFRGEIIGKKTVQYTFTSPAEPGTYVFQCDLHPEMYGEFIVN
jgi:plastocyanin